MALLCPIPGLFYPLCPTCVQQKITDTINAHCLAIGQEQQLWFNGTTDGYTTSLPGCGGQGPCTDRTGSLFLYEAPHLRQRTNGISAGKVWCTDRWRSPLIVHVDEYNLSWRRVYLSDKLSWLLSQSDKNHYAWVTFKSHLCRITELARGVIRNKTHRLSNQRHCQRLSLCGWKVYSDTLRTRAYAQTRMHTHACTHTQTILE